MKKGLVVSLFLVFALISADAFARGSSSRSSFSSSRSSSSSFRSTTAPKPAPSPVVKPAPAPNTTLPSRSTTGSSTFKKTATVAGAATVVGVAATEKPKAVSTSALDKQKQKMLVSQDKSAFKRYTTKADAERAYKQTLVSKNTYTSVTPPSQRPTHVPQTIIINNNSAPVAYGHFSNGGYGYGYMHPVTGIFIALAVNDMISDNNDMRQQGYGNWDQYGKPVIPHESHAGRTVAIVIGSILGLGLLIFLFKMMA